MIFIAKLVYSFYCEFSLCLPKQPDGHIGKYGRLRLNYLKNFDISFYTELLISGTLKQHLLDIDNDASNKVNLLIKSFAEDENVNEIVERTSSNGMGSGYE